MGYSSAFVSKMVMGFQLLDEKMFLTQLKKLPMKRAFYSSSTPSNKSLSSFDCKNSLSSTSIYVFMRVFSLEPSWLTAVLADMALMPASSSTRVID